MFGKNLSHKLSVSLCTQKTLEIFISKKLTKHVQTFYDKEFIKTTFYLAAHITVLFKIYLLSQKNFRQPDFKNVSLVLANKEQKLIACMKKVKKK